MGALKETVADGLKVSRAASDPTDVVRKAEFDAAIATLATSASVTSAVAAVQHDAVTKTDTDGILITLTGQAISAGINLRSDEVLQTAGGPTTETFSHPVTGGLTLTLTRQEVTVTSVARYDNNGPIPNTLVATGVAGTDYELDAVMGSLYIPTGSNLITITGQTVKVVYRWAQVEDTSGIIVNGDGVGLNFGTLYGQAARGNHRHPNDHKAATGGSTNSAAVTITPGQIVKATVTLDPAGHLEATSSGVRVKAADFAAPTHSHSNATTSAAGFMSAADKAKLDIIGSNSVSFIDSDTVDFSASSSGTTADVKLGAGLTTDSSGVAVDFTLVAAKSELPKHTYFGWADNVTTSSSVQTPINFSIVFDTNKKWMAVKQSTTVIASPAASDFSGLWGHLFQ